MRWSPHFARDAMRLRKAYALLERAFLSLCLWLPLMTGAVQARADNATDPDDTLEPRARQWHDVRLDGGVRVRGIEIGNRAYLGQTKIGGRWGFGIVVDRGHYAYAGGSQGLLILKRF